MRMDLVFQFSRAANTHTQTREGTALALSVQSSKPPFLQLLSPHWSWISVTLWRRARYSEEPLVRLNDALQFRSNYCL